MRELFESMSLQELRALAKEQGIRGVSTCRKGEVIDRLVQEAIAAQKTGEVSSGRDAGKTVSREETREYSPQSHQQRESRMGVQRVHAAPNSNIRTGMDRAASGMTEENGVRHVCRAAIWTAEIQWKGFLK